VQGLAPDATLRRVFDARFRQAALPPAGLMLSRVLAERLHVAPGDAVTADVLEGARDRRALRVHSLVDDFTGFWAYTTLDLARSLAREERSVTELQVSVDPRARDGVYAAIKRMPRVAGVTRRDQMIRFFREQSADVMLTMTLILALFASVISVSIVYNSARIALAMRSRELASLRVLGFTRGEVAAIIVGEQMAQVVMALPLGLLLGWLMAAGMAARIDPELFRLPLVISPRTYAFAALVTLGAGLASALLVRRRVDQLDMIAVLKARD
jgi:putative ABC transport system permease protein